MNTLFSIIIIALLVYIIYDTKKGNEGKKNTQISYRKILPEYLKKKCEISLTMPLPTIDIMFSVKGILTDIDEDWALIEVENKQQKILKMFRVDNINGVKEIV